MERLGTGIASVERIMRAGCSNCQQAARALACGIVNTLGSGATIVTPFLALGIEPRHRSLEELKGEDTAPAVLKEAS
jgi:hypothetical protein